MCIPIPGFSGGTSHPNFLNNTVGLSADGRYVSGQNGNEAYHYDAITGSSLGLGDVAECFGQ